MSTIQISAKMPPADTRPAIKNRPILENVLRQRWLTAEIWPADAKHHLLEVATAAVLCFLAPLVLPSQAYSATGAAFLKIGVGARAIGMGSAFTAISNDVTALYWNPAGLGQLTRKELGFMHAEMFANTRYEFLGYAHPTKIGVFGAGAVLLTQGAIEGRDENRKPTGSFTASDMALQLSYSRRAISWRTTVGVTARVMRQQIERNSAYGVAFDIGALWQTPLTNLTLGITARNIGPNMAFVSQGYSLPTSVNMGAAYRMVGMLTLSLDGRYQPSDRRCSVGMGAEFTPVSFIALRAGYLASVIKAVSQSGSQTGISSTKTTGADLTGFGGGMGFKLSRYRLDYAIIPATDLGSSHRVSFGVKF